MNIFIHILHNLLFIYFVIGDSHGHNVSGDVHTEVLRLQQMVKTIHGLSDSFYKALTTFTYESLSESQKMVYDQVMKIISHLRGCDIFVRCLFNNMHTPKSSDVDVVKIIGKESFTTDSSRILCANIEVHERKSVAISHGVQRVQRHHKTVLQCLECSHCVTNQRNFLVHKCEKHINKSTLDLPCRKECGKTLR